MYESLTDSKFREQRAIGYLKLHGWTSLGNWRFRSPSGSCHDMSAADLTQHQVIDEKKYFIV